MHESLPKGRHVKLKSQSAKPVALVTGGASGIGLAATRRLVGRGFHVAVLDVSDAGLSAVAQEYGGSVSTHHVDVSDFASLAEVVEKLEANEGPIEHVFGCAGIARVGNTLDERLEDVDLMMRVNFRGVVSLVHAALPPMLRRGRGEFAIVASATGLVAPRKMAAYGATKAAVIGYLSSLRYDIQGSGVKLACICPAAVATPMAEDFFADPEKRALSMAMRPEVVVKATENGLKRGRFLVLPGPVSKVGPWMARLSPRLIYAFQRSSRFDLVS